MDRRVALKKLGAGTAIAAGGSFVLSSNAVALTTSGPIIGIPDQPGETLPVTTPQVGFPARPSVTDASSVTCGPSSTPNTTYAWRLHSYRLATSTRFVRIAVSDLSGSSTISQGPIGASRWTNPSQAFFGGPSGMSLRRRFTLNFFGTTIQFNTPLSNGDQWVVDQMVTWQCSGSTPVAQTYRYSGTWPNPPTSQRLT